MILRAVRSADWLGFGVSTAFVFPATGSGVSVNVLGRLSCDFFVLLNFNRKFDHCSPPQGLVFIFLLFEVWKTPFKENRFFREHRCVVSLFPSKKNSTAVHLRKQLETNVVQNLLVPLLHQKESLLFCFLTSHERLHSNRFPPVFNLSPGFGLSSYFMPYSNWRCLGRKSCSVFQCLRLLRSQLFHWICFFVISYSYSKPKTNLSSVIYIINPFRALLYTNNVPKCI